MKDYILRNNFFAELPPERNYAVENKNKHHSLGRGFSSIIPFTVFTLEKVWLIKFNVIGIRVFL